MKHLVIFVTESGISSAVYNFKNSAQRQGNSGSMKKNISRHSIR